MKTIFKTMFAILVLILEALTVSAQKTKPDDHNCQSTISRSISEAGENGEISNIRTKKNEFNIITGPQLKPVNFISFSEKYYRSQVQKVDTSIFALTIPYWKKLSPAQKQVEIETQRTNNGDRADAAHKNNNVKRQLIYMVNNTSQEIALQMQDHSFIGVLEARIGKNNWRSVQYLHFSWCGNSYILKKIPAGSKAYFITPVLTGNYKTTLRYKILGKDKFYYSNEFQGNISYCDLHDTKYSPKEKLETFAKYHIYE